MRLLTTALAALLITAQGALAQQVGLDLTNRYVWRGAEQAGTSLQPSLNVGLGSAANLNFWGSYGIDEGTLAEINTSLSFAFSVMEMSLTGYYTDGDFLTFGDDDGPHEVEFGVSHTTSFGTASIGVFVHGANNDAWLQYDANIPLNNLVFTLGGGDGRYTTSGDLDLTLIGVATQVEGIGVSFIVNRDTEAAWVVGTLSL